MMSAGVIDAFFASSRPIVGRIAAAVAFGPFALSAFGSLLWSGGYLLPRRLRPREWDRKAAAVFRGKNFVLTAGALAFGPMVAIGVSYLAGLLVAKLTLLVLGSSYRLPTGLLSPGAVFIMATVGLLLLAHAKRVVVVPAVYLFSPKAPGNFGALWIRNAIRGAVAMNYRRRAYELATIVVVATMLDELRVVVLRDFSLAIPNAAIFGALITFLAVDTYIATFAPHYVAEEDAIDPLVMAPPPRDVKQEQVGSATTPPQDAEPAPPDPGRHSRRSPSDLSDA
jgi:hypothetical protein